MFLKTSPQRCLNIKLLFCAFVFFTNHQKTNAQQCDQSQQCEVQKFLDIIAQGQQGALSFVAPTSARQYATNDKCTKEKDLDNTNFDFVIIGSGSAGSVIANRLTEIEDFTVLLIEAGRHENEFIDIPGMSPFAPGTEYNWAFKSIPQNSCCLGFEKQECQFHRGRGVGGTTLINAVVYSRGSSEDYDLWNQTNPGWAYDDVLPYFIKSEDAHFPGADQGYHGVGGLYHVEQSSYTTPHIDAFLQANLELNYPEIDYNGRQHLGVSRIQYNTKHGRRLTTGAAFVQPAVERKNLKVTIESFVTKIHFVNQDEQLKATKVTFLKNGCEYTVNVNLEVILSAGTISSPQVLMHSGIGPADHLQDVNIEPLLDLPVGENFQDHIVIKGISIQTNTSIEILPLAQDVEQYLNGEGPFTLTAGHGALGFYKTPNSKDPGRADLEFVFITPNRTGPYTQQSNGFSDVTYHGLFDNLDSPSTMSVLLALEHPRSVGNIKLKSNDPLEYPLIDPRFLTDKDGYDIETLYQGVLILEKILATPAMRALDARFYSTNLPACNKLKNAGKRILHYCFIRQTSDELFHPVGTCKMAPKEDNGVVDEKLKVHGTVNLRVADASVIPFSMVGHTSAPSIMIGERCSDFVKEAHLSS